MAERDSGLNAIALSDLALDPAEGVTFHCLSPASIGIPSPPRFWLGDFGPDLSEWFFPRSRVLHPMGVFRARNISVSAGYLLRKDGRLIYCSEANIHPAHLTEIASNERYASVLTSPISSYLEGEHALICGPGYKIYGHWMVDFLPKLYFLVASGYDLDAIQLLVPSDLPRFAHELLRMIGIRESQLTPFDIQSQTIAPEILLIPTTCHNGVKFSSLFIDSLRWLKSNLAAVNGVVFPSGRGERIFVSRTGNRPLINRAEIETLAAKRGFKIVKPEKLPMLEQWSLFASSRCILGEYGSALHASIFSHEGTIVCALRSNSLPPGFVQSGIGEALNQPTGYVFGNIVDAIQKSYFIPAEMVECVLGMI